MTYMTMLVSWSTGRVGYLNAKILRWVLDFCLIWKLKERELMMNIDVKLDYADFRESRPNIADGKQFSSI